MTSEFEVKIRETKDTSLSSICKTLEFSNHSIKKVSNVLYDSSYKNIRTVLTKAVESNVMYIASL